MNPPPWTDSVLDGLLRTLSDRESLTLRLLVQRRAKQIEDTHPGTYESLLALADEAVHQVQRHVGSDRDVSLGLYLTEKVNAYLVYALAVYCMAPGGKRIGHATLHVPTKWWKERKIVTFTIDRKALARLRKRA